MTGTISGAGDRPREGSRVSDGTCETARSAEEVRYPAARRDEDEAGWQGTYLLKGAPLYSSEVFEKKRAQTPPCALLYLPSRRNHWTFLHRPQM